MRLRVGGPSPHVDWMREIGGRTYVGLSAGAGSWSYAQIRVLDGAQNSVVINQFDGDVVG